MSKYVRLIRLYIIKVARMCRLSSIFSGCTRRHADSALLPSKFGQMLTSHYIVRRKIRRHPIIITLTQSLILVVVFVWVSIYCNDEERTFLALV